MSCTKNGTSMRFSFCFIYTSKDYLNYQINLCFFLALFYIIEELYFYFVWNSVIFLAASK